jgi:hypothetical protein
MKSAFLLKAGNKFSSANIYIADKDKHPDFPAYLNVVIDGKNLRTLSFSLPKKDMKSLANGILRIIKTNRKKR